MTVYELELHDGNHDATALYASEASAREHLAEYCSAQWLDRGYAPHPDTFEDWALVEEYARRRAGAAWWKLGPRLVVD